MTARLRPEDRARPWMPATDVVPVHEFDRYNIPLSGILEQDGQMYLFACVFGEEDPDNVWAYAPVADDEIEHLRQLTGNDVLDAVEDALSNKPLVVAFANEWELEAWHMIDAGEEGPLRIARRFLRRWRRSLEQQRGQIDELEQKRELVDA